jgi:hypothetical protein
LDDPKTVVMNKHTATTKNNTLFFMLVLLS